MTKNAFEVERIEETENLELSFGGAMRIYLGRGHSKGGVCEAWVGIIESREGEDGGLWRKIFGFYLS